MARIYVYPADTTGCGSYRLIWVARVLAAQGHDITVVMPPDREKPPYQISGGYNRDGQLAEVYAPTDVDVVVMQRLTWRPLTQAIPLLRHKGIAVVIDIDDDLARVHPSNPAFAQLHPRTPVEHSWEYAFHACRDATMVTVSTEALLGRYAPHGRGRLLHNYVPARYLDIPHTDSETIGWGGAVFSHPDDLQTVGTSIARLVRAGHRFKVVGPAAGARAALVLDHDPDATGNVDIADWPHELAKLGVGVAPLADTKFNAAKSALKCAEMSALGVPWVASPRAEYARLHRLGVGLLAERPKDWYRQLSRLLREPALRQDMSARGREVSASLTIEAQAWRWIEAWTDALRIERQAATSAFARA